MLGLPSAPSGAFRPVSNGATAAVGDSRRSYFAKNRFQAIESCLRSLRARGYRPRLVVDGGA